jgi:hypothetical protein
MQLIQNMVHWWAFVNMIIKLLVPGRGVSSPAERLSASKEMHYFIELVTESAVPKLGSYFCSMMTQKHRLTSLAGIVLVFVSCSGSNGFIKN